MKKRIELTVSEMRRMREDGYSNKDIANVLDVSVATVYRYIGGQGKRIESVIPEVKPTVKVESRTLPAVKTVSETIAVNGFLFRRDGVNDKLLAYEEGNTQYFITLSVDRLQDYREAIEAAQAYFEGGCLRG